MKADRLFENIPEVPRAAVRHLPELQDLTADSRRVTPGTAFVAIPGTATDGRRFAAAALQSGAPFVVGEGGPPAGVPPGRWVRVTDARAALARLACALRGHPSRHLQVYGVTGTNGKTTVATVLQSVLNACGVSCGLVSTITCDLGGRTVAADHTTPDATVLQAYLAEMLAGGCRAASVEVSSHALMQRRTEGLRFAAAAFTNLTQDHLDYHGTMEAYGLAKRRLFEQLAENPKALAVVNLDDPWGRELRTWLRRSAVTTLTYGCDKAADVRATALRLETRCSRFLLHMPDGSCEIETPLLGAHNVANLLAVAGLASTAGLDAAQLAAVWRSLRPVRGRLERVEAAHRASLFVDYAHTPDALERSLRTLRGLTPGRLIVVFGCGGERDRGKRPLMGAIAARWADRVVLTSDNPRGEDPEAVLRDILEGFPATAPPPLVLADRHAALAAGLALTPGTADTLLVAGKGHETTQQFADRTLPFDDREELLRLTGATDVKGATTA